MSTTAKGIAFEDRVHSALAKELKNERLCASPKHATLHRKKRYHSKDRGASIITDVSLEVFLPDRNKPTIVWIFECKDYAGSVPVDDVEEFHSKLQQIGEDNTKGTIVTNGALQKSALSYARSKHIGVIRLLPNDQINHIFEYMTTASMSRTAKIDWSEFPHALTDPNHESRRAFFAASDGYYFGSWFSALSHVLSSKAT
jgi:hypothetical protein